jgi:RNA-directed DNA polymerase
VLINLLRKKISDHHFLRLIEVLITAPIREDKQNTVTTCGCPQGSILMWVIIIPSIDGLDSIM